MSDKIEIVGTPYLVECEPCKGTGTDQNNGEDCTYCDTLGNYLVVRVKRDTATIRARRERETYVGMRNYRAGLRR